MATSALQTLDDGEFWLPPQFLDDDVFVEDKMSFKNTHNNNVKAAFSPFDFPYEFNASDLSSPVESSLGSSDSDEEDTLLAGFTQKLAHSTLEDDFPPLDRTAKGRGISTSPQSPLCGSGCGCKSGSGNGELEGATWDLLYAAAGEVARIRMNQQLYACYSNNNAKNGYFAPPRKHTPISPPLNNNSSNNSHLPHLALYQKLQASHFHHLRQQQMMRRPQHYHSQAPLSHNRVSRPNTAGNVWPPLTQAQTGSGMRTVFMGNPQTKRECGGTGVFLPRRVGTPAEPSKKQASSTALLPAKVMHALSLNMDDAGPTQPHQPRFNNGEKRNMKPQQVINLPSEWTY